MLLLSVEQVTLEKLGKLRLVNWVKLLHRSRDKSIRFQGEKKLAKKSDLQRGFWAVSKSQGQEWVFVGLPLGDH